MLVLEIHIRLSEEDQEFLIARFQDDFEGFRTEKDELWAYATSEQWSPDLKDALAEWLKNHVDAKLLETKEIQETNWNAEWEKTIEPISAGQFIVLPSWSDLDTTGSEAIIIDPKMSFGTGHHETTRLMLGILGDNSLDKKEILDAGTGTGVLAIAAIKLGAKNVVAFDIDEWSTTNGKENCELNNVATEQIEFRTGNFEETIRSDETFDGILANINRNALLEMLPQFAAHIREGGFMLISGLLGSDEELFCDRASKEGFQLLEKVAENEWIGLRFRKA